MPPKSSQLKPLLARARNYFKIAQERSREAGVARLEGLFILEEVHQLPMLWRSRYSNWPALLKGEGLCSPSLWDVFQTSRRSLSQAEMRLYGPRVSITLGRLSAPSRKEMVQQIRRKRNQALSEEELLPLVRKRRNLEATEKRHKVRDLLAYAEELQRLLKKHKIKYPPLPRG